jgi:uncharacterized membrane protein (UPF0127 family)
MAKLSVMPGAWFRYIEFAGLAALLVIFVLVLLLPPKLSSQTLWIGSYVLQADLAIREEDRRRGLMFHLPLGEDKAMLFVFPQPQKVCMWMKYTFIPLSVAFVRSDGRIVNMADMSPLSTKGHCAKEDVLYALEVPRGWFDDREIVNGMAIKPLFPLQTPYHDRRLLSPWY